MSEEQLAALLAKLKDDAGLQEKLKGAADLDAAVALAKEAGFDVSKADLLKFQAEQTLELSDEELEVVAGGLYMKGGPGNGPADPPGGQKPMPFTVKLPYLGPFMYLGGGC
jgi:predicted ribosomally synthesized peptide with nif11-like leader